MRNKIRTFMGAFLLCLLVGSIYEADLCKAASAEIDISSDMTEFTVGEDVLVYITISSDDLFGDFEAYLTYDDTILEYRAGASSITGNSGILKISDIDVSDGSNTRKYALKFEALKIGNCQITFNERAMVYDYESGSEMSVSSNVLSVGVKATQTASSNTNLITLKTSPAALEPSFDPTVYHYSANVESEVENLIVSAVPEDAKATVSMSGNNFLQEGKNKVIVTVLAESGAVIEYTIDVLRSPKIEDTTDTEEEDTVIGGDLSTKHGSIEVVREDGLYYVIYGGKYQITQPDSNVMIPDGYIKTQIIVSDVSITAYSLKDDLENDFLLIYAMNELGEVGFYQYDRKERTIQRFVPEATNSYDNVTTSDPTEIIQSEEYQSNLNRAAIIIALLSVLSVLLIVILIRLFVKLKGYKADDFIS